MGLQFHDLQLKDQDRYRALMGKSGQHASDYSFINIWAWKDIYGLQWCFDLPGLVLIRQTRPEEIYWAPMGDWNSMDWKTNKEILFSMSSITRVPEELTRIWEKAFPENITTQSARSHWDYVYSVKELIELKGNRFHKKKNLLNQFLRKYDWSFVSLEDQHIDQALILQTDWCLWRDCEDSTTLEAENQAIINAFQDWNQLDGIIGGGLMVDGKMAAYTVAEELDEKTVIIHFEKACPTFKGAYQAINRIFLEEKCRRYELVNREQDLGDEGMRKAKMSYNPLEFTKKYHVAFH